MLSAGRDEQGLPNRVKHLLRPREEQFVVRDCEKCANWLWKRERVFEGSFSCVVDTCVLCGNVALDSMGSADLQYGREYRKDPSKYEALYGNWTSTALDGRAADKKSSRNYLKAESVFAGSGSAISLSKKGHSDDVKAPGNDSGRRRGAGKNDRVNRSLHVHEVEQLPVQSVGFHRERRLKAMAK